MGTGKMIVAGIVGIVAALVLIDIYFCGFW